MVDLLKKFGKDWVHVNVPDNPLKLDVPEIREKIEVGDSYKNLSNYVKDAVNESQKAQKTSQEVLLKMASTLQSTVAQGANATKALGKDIDRSMKDISGSIQSILKGLPYFAMAFGGAIIYRYSQYGTIW